MRRHERTLSFPEGSPCLAGHFPGAPVVPAVAILAELIAWTEAELGSRVTGVASSRFRKPLLPGVHWQVELEVPEATSAKLVARDQGDVVMQARFSLEPV